MGAHIPTCRKQAYLGVCPCDSTIKQIRADQEEIRAWLAAQEGGEKEWTTDATS